VAEGGEGGFEVRDLGAPDEPTLTHEAQQGGDDVVGDLAVLQSEVDEGDLSGACLLDQNHGSIFGTGGWGGPEPDLKLS
jgi:hypothetical protein